jgi:hypothetical protein
MELQKGETVCTPAAADTDAKCATKGAIDLRQDVAEVLKEKWGDLSQYALEILAVECYRSGALTPEQLHSMLSLRRHH